MKQKVIKWVNSYLPGLFIFNLTVIILVLLHGAGYFHPFFIITINFIVVSSLISSIFLLGARSRTMFVITFVFWLLSAFFRLGSIEIWAERASIYAFESFIVGVILLILEPIFGVLKKN